MIQSIIKMKNGKPYICINEELYVPFAYTTYFDECGEFSDFIQSGYRIFFVNVSFSTLPINNTTGFSPFLTGVFEEDIPNFSEFDANVLKILSLCSDALIFPRINITMPKKWIEKNPYDTVETPIGGSRESLYSDKFCCDGADYLHKLIEHIQDSEYAQNIAGYQLCGGTTQEWFHHDLSGSFSDIGVEKYKLWLKENHKAEDVILPEKEIFFSGENASLYGEFCGEMTAKTVEFFAKALKDIIDGKQIVGVFYGYNAFVNDYLWGHHGLRFIIDSPYIDFFSSPCAYDSGRKLGFDWGDMLPGESVRIHNKLYFVECDIRTYLTRKMQASRPGKYSENIYLQYDKDGNKTVWAGPDSLFLSISALRKAFAHQLTKGYGIWWFDMWGGWYHDKEIMDEIRKMKDIAQNAKEKDGTTCPSAQVVMFIDEKAYLNYLPGSEFCHSVNITRVNMGNTGIPFDLCMVEDAQKVIGKYKAAIFTAPIPSDNGESAVGLCDSLGIPCVKVSTKKPYYTENELRSILTENGIHCYNSDGHVVYCGEGFIAVHTKDSGDIKLTLPKKYRVIPILGCGTPECITDEIVLSLDKYDTAVFELE